MPAAALPVNEEERLSSLARSGLLQRRMDPRIKVITKLAASVFKRPMAALSLVGYDRQFIRAGVNMPLLSMPRADSFCAHAILQPDQPLIVTDAMLDRRFADNALVAGSNMGIRFYAGMPIRLQNGQAVGALCVLDQQPGSMSDAEARVLRGLGQSVEQIIQNYNPKARERDSILTELRRAATSASFGVQWQPISRADTLQVSGYEALIRWTRSSGVDVPPDEFIPLAESSGLIRAIDRAVMHMACTEAARDPARRVSVNVSAGWFRLGKPMLKRLVAEILARTGLPADRLTIELTERVLVDDAARALSEMQDLKSLGVKLALDDFGTGYSSLSYLEAFPFDVVKLDKCFVHGLGSNPRAEAVASAIIRLGHDLNMTICAEGVETVEQLSFLQSQDCDLVQGYLLGRPGPL